MSPPTKEIPKKRGRKPLPGGVVTEHHPLTRREQRFVVAYLQHLNATAAARQAGFGTKWAGWRGHTLLKKVNVKAAVDRAQQEWLDRVKLTAEREAADIENAANLDVAQLFDGEGHLLPVVMLPPYVRRAIVSIEVVKRNLTGGDGVMDEVVKIRLIDKGKMHEILARYTGIDKGDGAQQPSCPAFALPADTKGVSVH